MKRYSLITFNLLKNNLIKKILYFNVKNQLSPPLLRFACSPHYSVSLVHPLSSDVALVPKLTAREPDMHIDCYNMLFDAA